jgi:aromatic ring-opening dioxygenase catalytic subunit (LigB family)
MSSKSKFADFFRHLIDRIDVAALKAIVVVSAHWEESTVTVQTSPKPGMLFDYHGFPAHTYELSFPAPGHPALARKVAAALGGVGIKTREDAKRGFDHGVFVPLLLAFPEASVPVFQVSLHDSLDALLHIKMGAALAPLRGEGVLVVGSGFLTHNLGRMMGEVRMGPRGETAPSADPHFRAFVDWVHETLTSTALTQQERLRRLVAIAREAPYFREVHPREEHLTPLLVAWAAGEPGVAALLSELETAKGAGAAADAAAAATAAAPTASRIYHEWGGGTLSLTCYQFGR